MRETKTKTFQDRAVTETQARDWCKTFNPIPQMSLRQTATLKNFLLLEPQERCQILTSGIHSRIKETQIAGDSSVFKDKTSIINYKEKEK